jgi:hypothetical protein
MPKGVWKRKVNPISVQERRRIAAKKHYLAHPDWMLEKHLKMKYKLTLEQFNHMKIAQNNKCVVCGAEFSKDTTRSMQHPKDGARVVVDHNHVTGKVRELLCFRCNMAIGLFKENSYALRNAATYLEKWSLI